jgi:hypothetical protein
MMIQIHTKHEPTIDAFIESMARSGYRLLRRAEGALTATLTFARKEVANG